MKGLFVLQIEDRDVHFTRCFMEHNARMARKHGFRYQSRTEGYPDVPPWWWKVFAIDQLMDTERGVDVFMWLDSDAVLLPFRRTDPLALTENEPHFSVWISPDSPEYSSPFCAGSFLVRNDAAGRLLMRRWCSLYQADHWQRITEPDGNTIWKTEGKWAGDAYEQGSFTKFILPFSEAFRIHRLRYHVLNEKDALHPHPEALVLHLHTPHHTVMNQILAVSLVRLLICDERFVPFLFMFLFAFLWTTNLFR